MAKNPSEQFDSEICLDIVAFQEYIKRLRTLDDGIISNLNTTVLTSSFQKNANQNVDNCNKFHNQLKETYQTRDKLINTCMEEARAKVLALREATKKSTDQGPDMKAQKELKRQQARLRMIENELTVEQIIQDRSLKALHERCRRYVNL